MQIPLQIRFRNLEPSTFIEDAARKRAQKLERFVDDIVSCRVTIEAPHLKQHHGNLYNVSVDVRVPGKEIVVSRSPDDDHACEDVYVALRDAFDAARRQLQDYQRERRGRVKQHEVPLHGKVVELNPADDFGRITDSRNREVYFHRNSIVNADFDKLNLGDEVRFADEAGERGPQATTVYLIGKHHIVG